MAQIITKALMACTTAAARTTPTEKYMEKY